MFLRVPSARLQGTSCTLAHKQPTREESSQTSEKKVSESGTVLGCVQDWGVSHKENFSRIFWSSDADTVVCVAGELLSHFALPLLQPSQSDFTIKEREAGVRTWGTWIRLIPCSNTCWWVLFLKAVIFTNLISFLKSFILKVFEVVLFLFFAVNHWPASRKWKNIKHPEWKNKHQESSSVNSFIIRI